MVEQTKYLIVGASHAGLEALAAIRAADKFGTVTLVSRDAALPYSSAVLPYVMSGEAGPQSGFLCNEEYFTSNRVHFVHSEMLCQLDPEESVATFSSGGRVRYQKLLLATGATPVIPPLSGLTKAKARIHFLRTMEDALKVRATVAPGRRAVIIGGGPSGMQIAESLARAGLLVTVIETRSQILANYFDEDAACLIQAAFANNGVRVLTGRRAVAVLCHDEDCEIALEGGARLSADLLLLSTGARPTMDYLSGTAVARDRGILVDDSMRTNVANVWAAGDVAQARSFFIRQPVFTTSISDTVRQGRVAGLAMAGDRERVRYKGCVPLYTFDFFGMHALSVGFADEIACEVHRLTDTTTGIYLKAAIRENRLESIIAVGVLIDSNAMWELIASRIDLDPFKGRFMEQATRRFGTRH